MKPSHVNAKYEGCIKKTKDVNRQDGWRSKIQETNYREKKYARYTYKKAVDNKFSRGKFPSQNVALGKEQNTS